MVPLGWWLILFPGVVGEARVPDDTFDITFLVMFIMILSLSPCRLCQGHLVPADISAGLSDLCLSGRMTHTLIPGSTDTWY